MIPEPERAAENRLVGLLARGLAAEPGAAEREPAQFEREAMALLHAGAFARIRLREDEIRAEAIRTAFPRGLSPLGFRKAFAAFFLGSALAAALGLGLAAKRASPDGLRNASSSLDGVTASPR